MQSSRVNCGASLRVLPCAVFEELMLGIFSQSRGDLQLLDGRWYVTHAGLLQLASRRGCRGIRTILQEPFRMLKRVAGSSQADCLQRAPFRRVCVGYRRCRSFQHVFPSSWRRKCVLPNASRQPSAPKSLWNRALQCRRARVVLDSAKAPRGYASFKWPCQVERLKATASRDCVTNCAC